MVGLFHDIDMFPDPLV